VLVTRGDSSAEVDDTAAVHIFVHTV